jgi:hypothetical protein
MAQLHRSSSSPARRGVVTVLLAVAIIGTLWVPIYARSAPKLGAFPFFYWYQLIWVPTSAVLCWVCYLLLRSKPRHRGAKPR